MIQKLELVKSISEYSSRIKMYAPKMAKLYRQNNISDVTDMMLDLIEGIEWLISAIFIVEQNIDINSDELVNILPQIEETMKNTDYVLLADILEYELIPISDKITNKCNNFISNSMN